MSRRFALWTTAVVLLVASAGALVSWLDRARTLQSVAQFVTERSAGALRIEGVSGTLLRPIHIDHLVWHGDGHDVALDDVSFRWAPAWLLLATASFDDVRVGTATTTDGDVHSAPSTIPQTLRLPLRVRVHDAHVERVVYTRSDKRAEFSRLTFDAIAGWDAWGLTLAKVLTPLGAVTGSVRIDASPPFAVDGGLHVRREGDAPLLLDVNVSGALDRVELSATLRAQKSAAEASLVYAAFAEQPVERAAATLTALDLRHIVPGAPEAVFDGALNAATDKGTLRGAVTIENHMPGTIDADRVPFASLSAAIGAERGAWTLGDLKIDLGNAGRLAGDGRIGGDGMVLRVDGKNLDLHGAHATLRPTRLALNAEMRGDLESQDLRVAASQPGYKVAFDATVAPDAITVRRARADAGGGWAEASGRVNFDDERSFEVEAKTAHFDPSRFGRFRPASINGTVKASGSALPIVQVRADVDLAPSTAFGLPAAGKMQWRSRGIDDPRIAIDGNATIGETHASVKGQLVNPQDLRSLDLGLSLGGRNLEQLYQIFGLPFPRTPDYQVDGHLRYADHVWDFRRFTGRVGRSDVSGAFMIDLRPARPLMRADLTSERLDMRDLAGFIGAGETAPPNPPGKVLPHNEFKLDKLNAADADVRFTGRRIRNETLPLHRMQTHLVLRSGVLTLDPLRFGTAAGDIEGKVRLDARTQPIATFADLRGYGLQLDRFAPSVKQVLQNVGKVDGRIRLDMHGNSLAAMLANANGDVGLTTQGGAVSDLVLRLANLDLANATAVWMRGDRSIPVNCAVGDFSARDGVLTPRTLALDTEHTLISGEGRIDLRNEQMDLKLRAQPKDGSLFALRGPVNVGGTFADPNVKPDLTSALTRSGAAIVLGIIAPPAAVLPFVEIGRSDSFNCAQTIEAMARRVDAG